MSKNPSSYPSEYFQVKEVDEKIRVDQYLTHLFGERSSRTYFHRLIEEGCIFLNGKVPKKRELVSNGDQIKICWAPLEAPSLEPQNIPLEILFEDAFLVVVNKPPGLVVHPAPGHPSGTLVNALLYHVKEGLGGGESFRPGIVHRLDKDTSGVLVVAKAPEVHRELVKAFQAREVSKEYIAVLHGLPPQKHIETHIARSTKDRQKMAVFNDDHGKKAETLLDIIFEKAPLSVARVTLLTGRTHQIRVHMAHVGAPILGDSVYGNQRVNQQYGVQRQFLHAEKLSFEHPIRRKRVEFKAPIPQDMRLFIEENFPNSLTCASMGKFR